MRPRTESRREERRQHFLKITASSGFLRRARPIRPARISEADRGGSTWPRRRAVHNQARPPEDNALLGTWCELVVA